MNSKLAILSSVCFLNRSFEEMIDKLHSITNAQNRNAKIERFGIAVRRILVIHGAGPARQHDTNWLLRAYLVDRSRAWQNRGEDLLLANPARNELRVLASEIEYNDSALRAHGSSAFLLRRRPGLRHRFRPIDQKPLLQNNVHELLGNRNDLGDLLACYQRSDS